MKFIKLTGDDTQGDIFINPVNIFSVVNKGKWTLINSIDMNLYYSVKETPEEILKLIDEVNK